MGGLGKTTLAKSIYNRIHREFESACFVQGVSEGSKDASKGLKGLQKDMLQELLKTYEISVFNTARGKQMMQDRLEGKKVLIILDDVSEKEQLDELMPPRDCHLGKDSQIVITTQDQQVLMWAQVQTCLPMEGLSRSLAHELFNLHAFDLQEEPSRDLKKLQEDLAEKKKLAEKVADACQGLPLALEVLGSHLQGKDISEWKDTVKVLETRINPSAPQRKVIEKLKFSFDKLCSIEKKMFLDIACFLFQEPKDKGMRIWRSEDGDADAELNLKSLTRKCLVKLDENEELTMHDLLRDMGRDMADKSHNDYWKRSHLWRENDVFSVLQTKKGKSQVRGLSSNVEKEWETTAFTGMDELKLLVLTNVTLTGDFSKIPQELRWFQLRKCPLTTPLPLNEIGHEVVVLDLEGSKFTSFNCSDRTLEKNLKELNLKKLKELNLRNCSNLKEFPVDFCKSSNSLEILILSGCVNLERMPDSVGGLSSSLRYLDISGCSKLTALPNSITNLRALATLLMNNCDELTKLPDAIGQLTALQKIGLDRIPLSTLPLSFCSLSDLVSLCLDHSLNLTELPSTIGELRKLTSLDIISCPLISEIPPGVAKLKNLVHFRVSDCESVSQLPESIGSLKGLVELHLHDNVTLSSIPSTSTLRNLQILNLQGCPNLCEVRWLPPRLTSLDVAGCTSLKYLDMTWCSNLKSLPNGIESLRSLQEITVEGVSLSTLPQSFSDLSSLVSLCLRYCSELTGLPSTMGNLKKLTSLDIISCPVISEIPCLPATLTSLNMHGCSNLERIPASCLSSLINLTSLKLCDCTQLVELNGLECLGRLTRLDISGCRGLIDLPSGQLEKLTSLKELYLGGSGVSIVQDNRSPWIQKMVSLEVVSIVADEVPDCFKESQGGVHCLKIKSISFHNRLHMAVPEGGIACRGVLCCFVSARQTQRWNKLGSSDGSAQWLCATVARKGEGTILFNEKLFTFDFSDCTSHVHMCIYRASHPFVASLIKGGDEICFRVISPWRILGSPFSAAVVKLIFGENEMEETLQKLSLINKPMQMLRRRQRDESAALKRSLDREAKRQRQRQNRRDELPAKKANKGKGMNHDVVNYVLD